MQHFFSLAARVAPVSRFVALLGLLLALLLPGAARAQAPAWAGATPGSLTQANGTSFARATAVDAAGNVFVTGLFTGTVSFGATVLSSAGGNDLFVAKYVPATATWAWAQSGGGTSSDQGTGIAVSGSSVYVTGAIQNTTADASLVRFGGTGPTTGTAPQNGASTSSSSDLVVAKYTDNGTTATLGWTQVGGGTGGDQGFGIAVSGTSVYVTGIITNTTADVSLVRFGGAGTTAGAVVQHGASTSNGSDLVVAKYTDNGTSATLGWTQVGGGTSTDLGLGIAVSGTSVYVTGTILNNTADGNQVRFGGTGTTAGAAPQHGATASSSSDLVVAKYTDNGPTATLGWTQVGGGNGSDQGSGIAVSGTSVYVTGYIQNSTADAVLVRFGGTGTTAGTAPQNGASTSNSQDLVVAKYTDEGTTATLGWTQVGGGLNTDVGNGIAVSGSSVYVTGFIQNNTADGSLVRFGGTGTTAGTAPQNGATTSNSQDLVVAKYTDNGSSATLGWTQVGGGTNNDQGLGIAVSGTSVYVTGLVATSRTVDFGAAAGAPLLGTAGSRAVLATRTDNGPAGPWQTLAAASNGGTSTTRATAVDARGNVFVTGFFTGQVSFGATVLSSAGGNDLFVAKYVPATATWAWAQSGGGTSTDQGLGIAVSGTSVYVTGAIQNSTADASLVRFGGTGPMAGTVVQHGASTNNSQDLVVAKYTDNGTTATLDWTQVGGGTNNDQGLGIAVSGTSVYVTGFIQNNTGDFSLVRFGGTGTTAGTARQNGASGTFGSDLVVAKYTDNGPTATLGWTQVGGGTDTDQGNGIAVSGTSVYVTGLITNTTADGNQVRFGGTGPTAGTVVQHGASGTFGSDLVVAKYTDNGTSATLGWTQVGGGTGTDQGNGIAVSGTSVYVTGLITNNTADAGLVRFGGAGTTAGTARQNGASASVSSTQDLVVAKYTDDGATATLGWTQVGGGTGNDQGNGIAASGTSVYVTGLITNNTADVGLVRFGGTGTTAGTAVQNGASASGSSDLVVAKYTDNGTTATLGWTQVGGGTSTDQGLGIAVSGQNVLVGGVVVPAASFGSFGIANPAGASLNVLARLVDLTLTPLPIPTLTAVAPNPSGLGQSITLTGTNLSSPTALTINGANALAGILSNTGTSLVVRVPNTATATGNIVLTTADGTATFAFTIMAPPGNALAFDGSSDEVVSAATAPAFGTGDFTLEAWVRTSLGTGTQLAIGSVGGNANDYWLGMRNGFAATSATGTENVGTTAINDGRWHHLAGVRSGGQLTLYVDGVAVRTIANNLPASPAAPLGIGSFGNATTFWQGSLDEVRLWNVARTPAQLQAAMTAPLAGSETGLVRYYNFDQGTPAGNNAGLTTLYDLTASAAPATLNTFALTGTTSNYVESYAMVVPTATAATAVTTTGFTANWTAPALGTVDNGYRLDVSTSPAFASAVTGSPFTVSSGTSQAITGLTAGTTYYYRVRADKTSVTGQGAYSSTASAATCSLVTAVAQNVTVNLDANGNATVTAAAVNNGSTVGCGPAPAGTLSLTDNTNRLVNGTFDTNATGWTPANVDGNGGHRTTGGNPGGLYILNDNGNAGTDPTLSQTVTGLVNGATYVLRGDYRSFYAAGTLGAPALAVDRNGTQLATFPAVGFTWTPFSLTFTATGTSQTLAFRGEIGGTDVDVALDNLRLSQAGSTLSYTCANTGANSVTLTVTDAGGNTATALAVVTVTVPATPTTTWTGSLSTAWTDCANWSFGKVPDALTNVVIPASLVLYPTLSAGTLAAKDVTINLGGSLTVASGATLEVNGNFANSGTATLSGTVAFVGSAATQTLSNAGSFGTVAVNKPTGTVQLAQSLTINSALALTSGTLTTTGAYQVNLGGSASVSESETSYVIGKVAVNRPLVPGAAQSFSGLGLTLTPATGSVAPGATLVTRVTGTALTGVGSSVSVQRSFDIQPTMATGLDVAMTFGYFDHELNGIAEANLALFKSVSGAAGPWANQRPVTLNAAANTVSKAGITSFSIWTLGSTAAPLPVELTAFTATAEGNTAVRLAWATASETNSARFEVERSTDGRTFAAIGQVAGQGTTASPTSYALLDAKLPAGAPTLYYRLRQVDRDGTFSFSSVRVVTRTGQLVDKLTLAPNPARATTLTGAAAGTSVTVYDALGRTVLTATADATGTAQLVLPTGLATGVYVVRSGTRAVRLVVE